MAAVITVAAIAPAVLLTSSAFADGAATGSSTPSAQSSVTKTAVQQSEEPTGKDQQVEKDRNEILRIISLGGPGVKAAGKAALDGTPADMRKFLETGQFEERDTDNEVLISRIIYFGGPGVKEAGKAALKGTPEDRVAFLEAGQFKALDEDNYVLISRIFNEGGPFVKAAAKAALKGTPEDRVAFLQTGQFEARAKDKKA
ncbi:ALF repeat-containing protein [Streptomyces triculaminicus]|uniref:ALF repeat-containing protein n=1 Tax=Streptomyces triculaminicus TaxID=2816232 RepID=A0A939JQB8_9ACTN|nr:ALF repeat-containing protein [Streptomyces triculaminicus]MBO0657266.1 ALF repeat-containing protein [Streptomyces triculaminicus]